MTFSLISYLGTAGGIGARRSRGFNQQTSVALQIIALLLSEQPLAEVLSKVQRLFLGNPVSSRPGRKVSAPNFANRSLAGGGRSSSASLPANERSQKKAGRVTLCAPFVVITPGAQGLTRPTQSPHVVGYIVW